ncbi:MAG: hypothetical protein J2P45_03845 [Candidatus Dormibacteraeota bacterium]|nr:hypothetical protein [Candidatus Dormibacteraeota bacterium]
MTLSRRRSDAYNPAEEARPRRDDEDLVVGIGGVVMVFSEPAARGLMNRLARAVTAG